MNAQIRAMVLIAIPLLMTGFAIAKSPVAGSGEQVRQAAVAGSFYPSDTKELTVTVDSFLADARVPAQNGRIIALVAPHAGYPFSGAVAAHSYALLKGRPTHRVVVIAPSHYDAFPFASVYDGDAYATPLGKIAVDRGFARKLAHSSPNIQLSSRGHVPSPDGAEHSLEVQLPFLQRTLSDFQLVAIIMGDQSYEASRALGVALSDLLRGTDTLIVASSDLSHYHPYEQAVTLDAKTLNAIGEWDYLTLSDNFQSRTWEACGGGPIIAAMIAAERLGATSAKVIKYANSGDVTGDRNRVVGYSAVALFHNQGRGTEAPKFSLTRAEKRQLWEIANKSVESAVKDGKLYSLPANLSASLMQDRGAFVTIKKRGDLRGCIGYTAAIQPLALTVRDVAGFAALRDPRFPPVTADELSQLQYEISVLSPMRRVSDLTHIKVGEHGLLIKQGRYRGLLLPQVAIEQHWDRNAFLDETAIKAGLPAKAWRDKDADLFMFTAVVFGEYETSRVFTPELPVRTGSPTRPGEWVTGSAPR